MLKALYLLLMSFALAAMATAQNLVPNPSFEDTVNCDVQTQCMLLKAEHWRNPNLATPDVFDCDLDRICGDVMDPNDINNPPGYFHYAYDGLRFAGGYYWYGGLSSTREFLMARLTEALMAGETYAVSLWYVLPSNYRYGLDHIGVWFGTDSLFESTTGWLSVVPQARLFGQADYLSSDSWTQVSDTVVADGSEEWVVIGNFDPEGSENGATVNPTGLNPYAFYFLDAIVVQQVHGATDIIENELRVTCVDSRLWIAVTPHFEASMVRIHDSQGRLIDQVAVRNVTVHMEHHLGAVADGLYIVEVIGKLGTLSTRFVKGEGLQ